MKGAFVVSVVASALVVVAAEPSAVAYPACAVVGPVPAGLAAVAVVDASEPSAPSSAFACFGLSAVFVLAAVVAARESAGSLPPTTPR